MSLLIITYLLGRVFRETGGYCCLLQHRQIRSCSEGDPVEAFLTRYCYLESAIVAPCCSGSSIIGTSGLANARSRCSFMAYPMAGLPSCCSGLKLGRS